MSAAPPSPSSPLLAPRTLFALAGAVLAVNLAVTAVWLATAREHLDRFGQPLGGDFVLFRAAARLTAGGHALAAFAPGAMLAAERLDVPAMAHPLLWAYPPPFQLLVAPLAGLPFLAAFAAWTALGLAGYLAAVRQACDARGAALVALAFPAAAITAWQGQTSLFVAAALGLGLFSLDRRPWLAGAALGLLVCKPQFAVILPVLLMLTGRWRSLAGAALSSVALCAAAKGVFGWELWRAFFASLPQTSQSLADGSLPWSKVPSVFVGLAHAGVPQPVALAVHGAVGLAVAGATAVVWRRPGPLGPKAGLAALAALIVTPYAFNYDLVILALPIAAAAQAARTVPLDRWSWAGVAVLAATPTLMLPLAQASGVQVAPALLLFGFAMLARAALADQSGAETIPDALRPRSVQEPDSNPMRAH